MLVVSHTQSQSIATGSGTHFGQRQVEQLLDDRPDLRQVIKNGDPIHRWLEEAFDGQYFGQRIYWCSNEPENDLPSCFLLPFESSPALVLVSSDSKFNPFDKLAMVVFELHNVKNSPEMLHTYRIAKAKRIDREEFADKMVGLEIRTLAETHKFFEQNDVDGAFGRIYDWVSSVPPSLEEYKEKSTVRYSTRSNFDWYRRAYDKMVHSRTSIGAQDSRD